MNIINDPYTFNTVLNYALYAAVVFVFIMIGVCIVTAIIQRIIKKKQNKKNLLKDGKQKKLFSQQVNKITIRRY